MTGRVRVARAAIAAGLGAAMVVGPYTPAFAQAGAADTPVVGESANPEYMRQVEGESTGDTKLYVIGKQDDLTTSEGSVTENIKVSIPVAIHYVADSEGNLVGPSDNVVKFVNHTSLGSVHVSKIAVQNSGDAEIVVDSDDLEDDQMSFFITPQVGTSDAQGSSFTPTSGQTGTQDELGNYSNKTHAQAINPTNKGDWNIAQKNGALALNGLTGRIGGFDSVDPSTDYQAGTIHWTVRAGTRAQADVKDATVTIHYNSNNGSNANCVPVGDQSVQVLQTDALPNAVALSSGMDTVLSAGASSVTPPPSHTNADGSVTSYVFSGWNTKADGSGTTVRKVSDLASVQGDANAKAASLAGTVQEVYAIFTVAQ